MGGGGDNQGEEKKKKGDSSCASIDRYIFFSMYIYENNRYIVSKKKKLKIENKRINKIHTDTKFKYVHKQLSTSTCTVYKTKS